MIEIENTDEGTKLRLGLTLTREEFDALVMMAGMSTGAALRSGAQKLAYNFLAIANRLNEGNPDWTPYAIPPEVQSHE